MTVLTYILWTQLLVFVSCTPSATPCPPSFQSGAARFATAYPTEAECLKALEAKTEPSRTSTTQGMTVVFTDRLWCAPETVPPPAERPKE